MIRDEELKKKAENGVLFIEIMTRRELIEKRGSRQSARIAIASHARKLYMLSGRSKQCGVCGYDKHIEICHMRAVSSFSDDSFIGEINDLNNLVALCPNHHWEFDNNQLELE